MDTDPISQFRREGFAVARDVIPQESIKSLLAFAIESSRATIEETRAAVRALPEETLQEVVERLGREGVLDGLPDPMRQALSGHLPLKDRLSPRLWEIPRASKLQAILSELLHSDELYMHMPPTARFVPPSHSTAAVPPHQDVVYNRHMTDFITCWVPLVKIDDACGGVGIYPGTNKPVELNVGERGAFWFDGIDTANMTPMQYTMEPGDVLLFTKWLVHKSMPNISARTRYSIDCRFFGKQQHSSKHYLDIQTWRVIAPTGAAA